MREPMVECHDNSVDAEQSGDGISQRETEPRWGTIRKAVKVSQPAHCLPHRGEPGAPRVWPGLAVAGQPSDDEVRIHRMEPLGRESPPLKRPRPEILDDYVNVLDEPKAQALATRPAEIQ